MTQFSEVWIYLNNNLKPGLSIQNWTVFHGNIGDEMTIVGVTDKAITVSSPRAKYDQNIPKDDFSKMWAIWIDYNANKIKREEIRDITRFSKYIISILHWYDLQNE
jgi:hypothetical protein